MKDLSSFVEGPMSIIVSLPGFKAVCDICNTYETADIWIIKRYLPGYVKTVIKAQVVLPTKTSE